MAKDVRIYPSTTNIDFLDNSVLKARINLDVSNNLTIETSASLVIGDSSSDVYIGDGINNVDIVFEQDGEIRALAGKTLTLGQTDSVININSQKTTISNGNFGIAKSNPVEKFEVLGNSVMSGSLTVTGSVFVGTIPTGTSNDYIIWNSTTKRLETKTVAPGSSGTSGSAGSSGTSGSAGSSGTSGSSGSSGTRGSSGSSGTSGSAGSSGTSGSSGSSGTRGSSGSSGTSGSAGSSGTSGSSGSSGTRGSSGSSGTSGSSGSSGTSGSAGSSGTSGSSGSSGTSGAGTITGGVSSQVAVFDGATSLTSFSSLKFDGTSVLTVGQGTVSYPSSSISFLIHEEDGANDQVPVNLIVAGVSAIPDGEINVLLDVDGKSSPQTIAFLSDVSVGTSGSSGSSGTSGSSGSSGTHGSSGSSGTSGSSGSSGTRGSSGSSGTSGSSGSSGTRGSSGSSGTSGSSGSSGTSGSAGSSGTSGSAGSSGTSGSSGSSGTSGSAGSSGTSGSSGSSGTSGSSGSSGTSGSSGSSGTRGSSGSSGTSGSSGSSGTRGSSGSSGTSGSSGSSGTRGSSGSSGTSGSSGSSGTSGTLTLSGTTDNGVITLNVTQPNATVESKLIYTDANGLSIGDLNNFGKIRLGVADNLANDQDIIIQVPPAGTTVTGDVTLTLPGGVSSGTIALTSDIAITSLSSATNNRLITSDGGTSATAESNLLFDGTHLAIRTGSFDSILVIKQDANDNAGGIRLVRSDATNYWAIYNGANTLQFKYNGATQGGYLSDTVDVSNIDFTGQHRSLVGENDNTPPFTREELVGLIVIADGTYTNLDGSTEPKINEAIPNVLLSETSYDKRVFGVVSDKEDLENGERKYTVGNWVSTYDSSGSVEERLIINSLGEGSMWVCNYSGSFENGDYITTSPIKGLGMKQDDDILHNYTVGKITQDCNFDISGSYIEFEFSGSMYRKQFVGVTYHCG